MTASLSSGEWVSIKDAAEIASLKLKIVVHSRKLRRMTDNPARNPFGEIKREPWTGFLKGERVFIQRAALDRWVESEAARIKERIRKSLRKSSRVAA